MTSLKIRCNMTRIHARFLAPKNNIKHKHGRDNVAAVLTIATLLVNEKH